MGRVVIQRTYSLIYMCEMRWVSSDINAHRRYNCTEVELIYAKKMFAQYAFSCGRVVPELRAEGSFGL
jgi:hypothetical protein